MEASEDLAAALLSPGTMLLPTLLGPFGNFGSLMASLGRFQLAAEHQTGGQTVRLSCQDDQLLWF